MPGPLENICGRFGKKLCLNLQDGLQEV